LIVKSAVNGMRFLQKFIVNIGVKESEKDTLALVAGRISSRIFRLLRESGRHRLQGE